AFSLPFSVPFAAPVELLRPRFFFGGWPASPGKGSACEAAAVDAPDVEVSDVKVSDVEVSVLGASEFRAIAACAVWISVVSSIIARF
ncbi:MAG: hypothetical protein ABW213_11145, partial [Tardiphaga sp.]